jgi:hypothetical protein
MYGIRLDPANLISFPLSAGAAGKEDDALPRLLGKIEENVPGEEDDCTYKCSLHPEERAILIEIRKDSLVYRGPWWAEYSVITRDLWMGGDSMGALVCQAVWGPAKIELLLDDEARKVADRINRRLSKIVGG